MTSSEKKNIKRLLKEWGSSSKTLQADKGEIARFEKACRAIGEAQREKAGCEIISMAELKSRAERLGIGLNSRISRKGMLDEIIGGMPYDMQTVLRIRYIKGVSWEYLPVNMPFDVSLRTCYRLHKEAMEIINTKYNFVECADDIC